MANVPATVTVACKFPVGLILRTFKMVDTTQLTQAGQAVKVPMAQAEDQQFFVHGPSHAQNKAPKTEIRDAFALTPNVPGEFWAKWLEQNRDSDLVRNGLIFAHDERSVRAQTADHAKQMSGLERLDPNAMPKGLSQADKPTTH